jgi:hypothetical protein
VHPVEVDVVVVGESAGKLPDAILGAAFLTGMYGVIDKSDIHGYLLRNYRVIQFRNLVAHPSEEFFDASWI